MFHWLAAVVRVRLSPRGDSGVDFPEDMLPLNKFVWRQIFLLWHATIKHMYKLFTSSKFKCGDVSTVCISIINITIIITVSNQSE